MLYKQSIILLAFTIISISSYSQPDSSAFNFKCDTVLLQNNALNCNNSNHQVKLPLNWTGTFSGELCGLIAKKKNDTTLITIEAHLSWDVNTNNNEIQKENENYLTTFTLDSQEVIVIYKKQELTKSPKNHNYQFHVKTKTSWVWRLYVNTNIELDISSTCEIKHIISDLLTD